MLTVYGLLSSDAEPVSVEQLAARLEQFFRTTDKFTIQLEQDPFDSRLQNILMCWGSWWARVFCETDLQAAEESPAGALHEDRGDKRRGSRIRVLCADDDAREYTNQVIWLMDFLAEIRGVTVATDSGPTRP